MKLTKLFPLWKQALFALVCVGSFFFLSYGLANKYTASLTSVPSIAFAWEKYIPFLPWTIIPYWSIDFLYCISFFLCLSKRELFVHSARLFVASCFCCTCFVLFPLACSFVLPEITNPLFHKMIYGSGLVATPFNQAPSLHIALAWLVWLRFRAHSGGKFYLILSVWFVLICVSVLTCYQHHFIDVPLGLLAGILISYLLPIQSYKRILPADKFKRAKLGSFYLFGSLLCVFVAWGLKGFFLWLFWPAISLLIVALGYFLWGTAVFQKDMQGKMTLSARVLLAPYILGAGISKYFFTRNLPEYVQVTGKVYLGALPSKNTIKADGLLDLTAEFDTSEIECKNKIICPRMDLVAQTPAQIQEAVLKLTELTESGTALICCALGLSRSAITAAAYLITQNLNLTAEEAIDKVKQQRPQVVFDRKQTAALKQWEQIYIKNRSVYAGKTIK